MKLIYLFILLAIVVNNTSKAQEIQVPFDSAGNILTITSDLEQQFQLFSEYEHFNEAKLFQNGDSAYVLEISYYENNKLLRVKENKNQAGVDRLRFLISERIENVVPSSYIDQSSRTKFLIWETGLSVFVYSQLLQSSFDQNNGTLSSGITLVTGGLGFFIPYLITQHASVTAGQSSLALGGAFLGLYHGVLIHGLIAGEPGHELGTVVTLTSIVETGIGYAVAGSTKMTEGTADVIRYTSLFGALQAHAAVYLADDNAGDTRPFYAAGLVGSGLGIYVGTLLTSDATYTRGNASVLGTSGLYGSFLSGALVATILENSTGSSARIPVVLSLMAGNIGGYYFAHNYLKHRSLSTSEGNMVILGSTAGLLIGTGIGYILTGGGSFSNSSSWQINLPTIFCTAAGYYFTLSAAGKGHASLQDIGWKFDFNPGAALAALLPSGHSNTIAMNIGTLRYSW